MNINKKVVYTLITIGFVLFIFHNSLFPGPQSHDQSNFFMNLLNQISGSLKIHVEFSDFMIRKAAHFTEYFIYGILLTHTIRQYRYKKLTSLFMKLFFLLLIPVVDEFIQVFTPDRGSSVADVMLDFCSGCAAMLVCNIISYFHVKRTKNVKNEFGKDVKFKNIFL